MTLTVLTGPHGGVYLGKVCTVKWLARHDINSVDWATWRILHRKGQLNLLTLFTGTNTYTNFIDPDKIAHNDYTICQCVNNF